MSTYTYAFVKKNKKNISTCQNKNKVCWLDPYHKPKSLLKCPSIYKPIDLIMLSGLFYLNSSYWSTSNSRLFGSFLLLQCFIEIHVFNASRVDSDQIPVSDLGLHCLPITILAVARLKWVN